MRKCRVPAEGEPDKDEIYQAVKTGNTDGILRDYAVLIEDGNVLTCR